MEQRYLIDSNVIIDYFALRLPQTASDFAENLFDNEFLTSVIVKIEVLGFNDFPDKLEAIEDFFNAAKTLPLDEMVTQQTILLRRNYKKLKLGDAIIAATAIVHHLTLLSRNIKDFERISNLQVINPHTI